MVVDGSEHSYDYDKLYQIVNVDYPSGTGLGDCGTCLMYGRMIADSGLPTNCPAGFRILE